MLEFGAEQVAESRGEVGEGLGGQRPIGEGCVCGCGCVCAHISGQATGSLESKADL